MIYGNICLTCFPLLEARKQETFMPFEYEIIAERRVIDKQIS